MWQSLTKGIFGQVTSVTLNKTYRRDDPKNADWEFAGIQNISSANIKTIKYFAWLHQSKVSIGFVFNWLVKFCLTACFWHSINNPLFWFQKWGGAGTGRPSGSISWWLIQLLPKIYWKQNDIFCGYWGGYSLNLLWN